MPQTARVPHALLLVFIHARCQNIQHADLPAVPTSSRMLTRTVHSGARVTANPWPCSCDCLCSHRPLNSDGSHSQLWTHSMPAHAHCPSQSQWVAAIKPEQQMAGTGGPQNS